MAIDSWLLGNAEQNGTATLRLYRWSPGCLSFGRNEPALTRYDRAKIESLGLDVVRRPTGGRAVWHEHEVTYSVTAPIALFGALKQAYCAIHQRIADALSTFGLRPSLAPDRHARASSALGIGACFASPVGGEVLINSRKAVGSAQVRQGDAFLQHGSILLDGSQDIVQQVSRTPGAPAHAITLREALGRPVSFDEVAAAVADAFGAGKPEATLRVTTDQRFADGAWNWRR